MNPHNLFDETSALIVVGGTLLATLLRCGFADSAAALVALRGLLRRRFRGVHLKAELAVHVQEMRQDGVIRTQPHLSGDAEIDAATDALIGSRSVAGLHIAHIAHKRRRAEHAMRAVRTLSQAADLSPVLGLAGTLVSLSQLPAGGAASGASGGGSFTAAISMAVLTTLYGLLLGNMVFAPLARMVARRAAEEEKERQAVLDWLEQQVAVALPSQAASPLIPPGKAPSASQGKAGPASPGKAPPTRVAADKAEGAAVPLATKR